MKKLTATFVTAVIALSSPVRAQDELTITNGLASQKYMGTGKGVIVGVLDAGIDVTHPAIRGQVQAQKDFTNTKTLDDDKEDEGHGTGVAAIMMGHDKKSYNGMAPGAKLINAHVVRADDWTTDLWAGNGLLWTAKSGAKVVNMSFGNKVGDGPLTDKFNLISDYVAEKYGMSIVSAAGNENDSAVQQSPAGSYNGYAIGALGKDLVRASDFSNYALPHDARSKPDLVAPGVDVPIAAADWEKEVNYWTGTGTSFASPMVGGILAQMTGFGKSKKMSTSPLVLKAVLMASATHVKGNGGDGWEPRSAGADDDYGYLATQPLDDEQGAGRVDALAAYRLYAKSRTKEIPYNVWKEGKLKGNDTFTIKMGKFAAGEHVDATLTWYRHVAVKDKNHNGVDAKDSFYQNGELADFTLTLLCDGVPVSGSDSDVDNLEHISWNLAKKGTYSLAVYRFTEGGLANEPFAVAARVLASAQAAGVSRSLVAGRGEATYLDGVLRGVVPEPSGLLGVLGMFSLLLRRRR
jgi:hypothetical protein